MNNKIKVNIAGSVYTIIGEKSKDEVEAIANFVDEEIKKITSQNYLLNSTMAATLVALNVSSDNFDLRKEINLLSEDSEFPIKKQEEFLKNNQNLGSFEIGFTYAFDKATIVVENINEKEKYNNPNIIAYTKVEYSNSMIPMNLDYYGIKIERT